jgi:hypothetical protein
MPPLTLVDFTSSADVVDVCFDGHAFFHDFDFKEGNTFAQRGVDIKSLAWNLVGKERTRIKVVVETAPKNPAPVRNP